VDECGSEFNRVRICTLVDGDGFAHLVTGSLIATRKSWACSAIGEKASTIIRSSSELIQMGRAGWSALK